MPGVGARGLLRSQAHLNHDPLLGQAPVAGARHQRIGISHRGDHTRNSGRDNRIGAGRRLTLMGAGFERHVERRSTGIFAGARERLGFGMGTPARLSSAPPDDDAVLHHYRADRRIGPSAAQAAPPERKRKRHEARVTLLLWRRAHVASSRRQGAIDEECCTLCRNITRSKQPVMGRRKPRSREQLRYLGRAFAQRRRCRKHRKPSDCGARKGFRHQWMPERSE